MANLNSAFGFFTTRLRNARGGDLSARNEGDKTVVLALWRDRLDYSRRPSVSYRLQRTGGEVSDWLDMPGNRARLADLKWAREHCEGCFRVVIIEATDLAAEPREIAVATPQQRMVMKLTELDEETGEFAALAQGMPLAPLPSAAANLPVDPKSKGRKARLLAG